MPLKGKFALVTGAAGGMGLSVVERLSEAECQVIATDMVEQEEVRNKMSGIQRVSEIKYIQCDLRRQESIHELCGELDAICPNGIDILVNAAGRLSTGNPVETLSAEIWKDDLHVNLTTPFILTKHVLPSMKKKKWGRIVYVASNLGLVGASNTASYVASKTGLCGLTKAVALETAEYGVTCNAICPGATESPMFHRFLLHHEKTHDIPYEKMKETLRNTIPTKTYSQVSQISSFVMFLCSPGADNMTGTTVPMDGGIVAM